MSLSELPSKGDILWLPPQDEIAKHSLYTGDGRPHQEAHDRPVVVLGTDEEDGHAVAVIFTVCPNLDPFRLPSIS